MAQKTAKKKTKKAAKPLSDPSVLGNLRATRASRIGGDRRTATTATAAKPSAAKKASATATKPTAAKKASATAAKPSATKKASGTKAPASKKPRSATTAKPAAAAPPPPRPEPSRDGGRPSTTEVVTTAVQAAGELAQIGLTVGRQVLKRATDRLPRP